MLIAETSRVVALPGVSLPGPSRPPSAAPMVRARATEIRLHAIAHRLGLAARPTRTIIANIRLMIAKRGFPLPKTPRFLNGEPVTGPRAVHAHSVWDRDEVDLWFEDDAPPPVAAAGRQRTLEATRADLAARARGLVA